MVIKRARRIEEDEGREVQDSRLRRLLNELQVELARMAVTQLQLVQFDGVETLEATSRNRLAAVLTQQP